MTNTLYRAFRTTEEINAQYDPFIDREREPVVNNWLGMSEKTLETIDQPKRIMFGQHKSDFIDYYSQSKGNRHLQTRDAKRPLHIFIHGGYWRALSTDEFKFVARHLVTAGIDVAIINYDLCPRVSIDEIVSQVNRAVTWLCTHSEQMGIDINNISLSGHSAGGHLVAMLMTDRLIESDQEPEIRFKGAIGISGVYDLGPFPHSWLQPVLQLGQEDIQNLSPILLKPMHSKRLDTPMHLFYGKAEPSEFERQSTAYSDYLKTQGVDSRCVGFEGADHFTVLNQFNDSESVLTKTVLAFHIN